MLLLLLACQADESPEHLGLIEGGVVICADPDARDRLGPFEDGLQFPISAEITEEQWRHGTAIAAGDLDGDGLGDVVLSAYQRLQLFLQQPDGSFLDATDRIDLPEPHAVEAVGLIDLDGDGDLDMLISFAESGSGILLSDGGRFSLAEQTGLEAELERTKGFYWGDMDGDGDLDLSLANDRDTLPPEPGGANSLFERTGPLSFVDVSDRLEDEWRDGYTKLAPFFDADMDGTPDLYVVNHKPGYVGNFLLRNDGAGQFSSWPEPGLDLSISGMSFSQADLNEDGWPDLLISDTAGILVLLSDGDGGWYQAQAALELLVREEDQRIEAWSSQWADLNSDGRVDVYSGFGTIETPDAKDPLPFDEERDGIWLQTEAGTFEDVSAEWGMDQTANNRAGLVADLNGDGWLDVLKGENFGPAVLYRARCGSEAWATVALSGEAENIHGVGAEVALLADGRWQRRWVAGMGAGYHASQPHTVHFGLGDAERIDELHVRWPDGSTSAFTDITSRQHLTVRRHP